MVIGIPITTIAINWTSNRHFDYSIFDNLMYKYRIKSKTIVIGIVAILLILYVTLTTKINYLPFINKYPICKTICMNRCSIDYGRDADTWEYSSKFNNCNCRCMGGGTTIVSPN